MRTIPGGTGSGTVYYLTTDNLSDTALVTNSSAAMVNRVRYFPFGAIRTQEFGGGQSTLLTDKLFTGQQRETTNEVYHYGARLYNADIGRFISADTVVPEPGNPQALNRYSYVLNNPLRYTDPTGNRWIDMDTQGDFCCRPAGGHPPQMVTPEDRFCPVLCFERTGPSSTDIAIKNFAVGMVIGIPELFIDWGKEDVACIKGHCNYGKLAFYTALVAATVLTAGELGAAEGAAEGIVANRIAGIAAEDAIAAGLTGARTRVPLLTRLGWRVVDVLGADRAVIESKVGYTSLTKSVQAQIAKDELLIQTGRATSVQWAFTPSEVTGLVGPSLPLQLRLESAGIRWYIRP